MTTDDASVVVGELLAGTDTGGFSQPLAAVVDELRRRDPAFDPAQFEAWVGDVHTMAAVAWRDADAAVLRTVMSAEVWQRYAGLFSLLEALPGLRQLLASATARPSLQVATLDAEHDTIVVAYDVHATERGPVADALGEGATAWSEQWVFQRPAGTRTHPSGAVAVCSNCGAPARPDEVGACPYCHADLITRTAGWQATRVLTTMPLLVHTQTRLAEARTPLPGPASATTPVAPDGFRPPPQPTRAG
jgi:hypothetical protein